MTSPYRTLLAGFIVLFCGAMPVHAMASNAVDAVEAAQSKNWDRAQALAARSGDAAAQDLVLWMYLTDDDTRPSFNQIATFVSRNPDWPANAKLHRMAERRMPDDLSNQQIISWFSQNEPVSATGMNRYLCALLAERQTQTALESLRGWWPTANLGVDEQNFMIDEFGSYLGTPDHARRLEFITSEKDYPQAMALARRMGGGYVAITEARMAIQDGGKGIEAKMSKVPKGLSDDPGLILSRVQYRRENDMNDEAISLLNRVSKQDQLVNAKEWWRERNILARRMIEAQRYRDAYKLASNNGLPTGTSDYAQAEFLSGWLALRFLKKPYEAFEHFERMFNGVKTPISRARAAYWAGQASEALGNRDIAIEWYQVAARYQTTFYGQQAAKRIDLPLTLINGQHPPVTRAEKAAFSQHTLPRAAKLLHEAGIKNMRSQFLLALGESAQTPQDYTLAANFAASLGQIKDALKIAKDAETMGLYLIEYSFPTISDTVKDYGVDRALVHAVIRQESQFDQFAESSAGALGLMQVMPATGKYTANKNGLTHQTSWLTDDPSHNVKIGTYYMQGLLDRYDGSMPLAIAAYNAGPGRVNEWLREFGDPRTGQVSMIDWLELIPIYETRNYVQRVLEGYEVYRMRLGQKRIDPARRTPLADIQPAGGQ